jgi:hypothetical protein
MGTKTKVKARRMYKNTSVFSMNGMFLYDSIKAMKEVNSYRDDPFLITPLPVAVIPLDDVTALITKAGDAFAKSYDGHLCQSDIVAMLTAIGVLPKQRKGRK